jgi:hypothetical protein
MMFRALRAVPVKKVAAQRNVAGLSEALYNNLWKKSNISYITYIVTGCVVLEAVYGKVTNFIWESYNYGVSLLFFSNLK